MRRRCTSPKPGRTAIVVADLVGKKAGDNPHLWYDAGTMPAAAKALAEAFAKADAAHKRMVDLATGIVHEAVDRSTLRNLS